MVVAIAVGQRCLVTMDRVKLIADGRLSWRPAVLQGS
jgi:hypothetical protein